MAAGRGDWPTLGGERMPDYRSVVGRRLVMQWHIRVVTLFVWISANV